MIEKFVKRYAYEENRNDTVIEQYFRKIENTVDRTFFIIIWI